LARDFRKTSKTVLGQFLANFGIVAHA